MGFSLNKGVLKAYTRISHLHQYFKHKEHGPCSRLAKKRSLNTAYVSRTKALEPMMPESVKYRVRYLNRLIRANSKSSELSSDKISKFWPFPVYPWLLFLTRSILIRQRLFATIKQLPPNDMILLLFRLKISNPKIESITLAITPPLTA